MQTDPKLLSNARHLRREMTDAEKKLWFSFLRIYSPRFRRQHVMDCYILDFYCASAKLAVELDGGQHYEDIQMEYDKARTEYLERKGILVLRYTNVDVLKRFRAVCEDIDYHVKERMG